MKFLVDESTGKSIAKLLRSLNFDTLFVGEDFQGIKDTEILAKANKENRILITNDKDFGYLIFYQSLPHKGIILLRLKDESAKHKVLTIKKLINYYQKELPKNFIVVTERKIRVRKN